MSADSAAPYRLGAAEGAAAIRRGELTSEALVSSCLERIVDRESVVSAWQYLDTEHAISQARSRDREPARGPLHGVPIALKDLIDTCDQPTTYGSPIFGGHRPKRDAWVTRRLREAGAVILGKTVTPEFAASGVLGGSIPRTREFEPKVTLNPHDLGRTAGKSSSGSAAAVADQMVPLSLGTQTAGSIVVPASFCGVFGFKPTHGAVSLSGVKSISPTLDTIGLMARSVEDLSLGATTLMGDGLTRALREVVVARPRIGLLRAFPGAQASPTTEAAFDELVAVLDGPSSLCDIVLTDDFSGFAEAQEVIMHFETVAALARDLATSSGMMSDELRERIDPSQRPPEEQYSHSLNLARRSQRGLSDVFAECDVILTLSAAGEAPHQSDMSAAQFCRPWSLLGTPVESIPAPHGPDGLPIGVQLVGPLAADALVLAVSEWIVDRLDRDGFGGPGTAGRCDHTA